MKLNKKLEIALIALNALKTKETATKTADLAVEVGTTVHFLEQIMRNLRTANIVTVKRGPGGGYFFNKDLVELNAYRVAKAVGRNFGNVTLDNAPTSRLSQSIVEAFLNTTI
jgi:Rrf2 family protein